jgi:hypothetical protein
MEGVHVMVTRLTLHFCRPRGGKRHDSVRRGCRHGAGLPSPSSALRVPAAGSRQPPPQQPATQVSPVYDSMCQLSITQGAMGGQLSWLHHSFPQADTANTLPS